VTLEPGDIDLRALLGPSPSAPQQFHQKQPAPPESVHRTRNSHGFPSAHSACAIICSRSVLRNLLRLQ